MGRARSKGEPWEGVVGTLGLAALEAGCSTLTPQGPQAAHLGHSPHWDCADAWGPKESESSGLVWDVALGLYSWLNTSLAGSRT